MASVAGLLKFKTFLFTFLFLCSCATSLTAGTPESGTLELVQSIPEETALGLKELPYAAPTWITMIKNAKQSIDLGQFYMVSKKGELLEDVIAELEKAAARGVKIRILVSPAMLKDYPDPFGRLSKLPNIEGRIYDLSKTTGGILHAKYWVIDGREIFVGSQNFDWRALTQIHETGLHIEDVRLASQLKAIFEIDWKFAKDAIVPNPPPERPSPTRPDVELVASPQAFNPPGTREAIKALVELIGQAKQNISIQLLQYSNITHDGKTWDIIDGALRSAAAKGVKVRLLVSDWNKREPGFTSIKRLNAAPGVEIKIATIPAHSSGPIPYARVIHSKYMVIDSDVLWVGTSNWEQGYFSASRNIEIIVRSNPLLIGQGQKIFEQIWTSSYVEDAPR